MTYSWKRYGGYECSSHGDKRFSAFYAFLSDGRSIEKHYQCDIKGYNPGGHDWRLGKGKPGLNPNVNLWKEYLTLWRLWAMDHQAEVRELAELAKAHNGILSDKFAKSSINQAHALSIILNELLA